MNIDNIRAQMRKGILELCILSILDCHGQCYATEMIEHMKRANLLVVEGTVYPLLARLKNEEYLSYTWVESTSGPPRKYYQLTDKGRLLLNGLREVWAELQSAVASVANKQPAE